MKTVYLSVAAMKRAYWPRDVMGMYKLADVLSAAPIAGFVSEYDREESYHLGRVRYFYDLLQTPTTELDPVTLDPPGLWLHDGHHRYAAYVLAKRAWIPATVLRGHLDPKIRLRP